MMGFKLKYGSKRDPLSLSSSPWPFHEKNIYNTNFYWIHDAYSVFHSLIYKHMETHECVLSSVATDALVLETIRSSVFTMLPSHAFMHSVVPFVLKKLHL